MIGLLPAAGYASRFNGFPKFLLPIPGGTLLGTHVERMRAAGVSEVSIGAGHHNVDTLERYKPHRTRLYIGGRTMSETVLNVQKSIGDEPVLFGMPDTHWIEHNAYDTLNLQHCDVNVALWKIRDNQRGKLGQCELDFDDRIVRVVDKNESCPFEFAWGAMAWSNKFWEFIKPDMPHIGYALQPAIDAGLKVMGTVIVGDYYDCGTLESYVECLNHCAVKGHVTA